MFGVGLSNGFSAISDYLEGTTWVFLLSCWVQGFTSVHMAMKYRKNDHIAQTGFITGASGMILAGWQALYLSQFAPDALNNFLIGNVPMSIPLVVSATLGVKDVIFLKEGIEQRGIRNIENGGDLGKFGDFLSYSIVAWGPVILAALAISHFMDPSHDRQWMLHACMPMTIRWVICLLRQTITMLFGALRHLDMDPWP